MALRRVWDDLQGARRVDPPVVHAKDSAGAVVGWFICAVLGFSFWFFLAVPFASHRESYWWLAMVHEEKFAEAFSFISSTYRPLHQAAAWVGFLLLGVETFPTNVVRQALLQLFVYGMFILAWWLMYRAAPQPRVFALLGLVAGAVFFSGYVQLFHIYGIAYVPVMLTLGVLLGLHASGRLGEYGGWLGVGAMLLVLWHPFAPALFVGCYAGLYAEQVLALRGREHIRAIGILLSGIAVIGAAIVALPRLWPEVPPLLVETATRPVDTRLFGLIVSYQTNEVNWIASATAFVLALGVVLSTGWPRRVKMVAGFLVAGVGVGLVTSGLPLLFAWVGAAAAKLLIRRSWSLLCLTLTAALLPFGGGIGTPIYALFAIIMAAYATALGWVGAERALASLKTLYIVCIIGMAIVVVAGNRAGMSVPMLAEAARPLLTERERTYQLERVLDWLRESAYCDRDLYFVDMADNPIDSVEGVVARRYRPPAAEGDVRLFWDRVLRCERREREAGGARRIWVTFGDQALADAMPVYRVDGRYGAAVVWLKKEGE